jgi:SSS family solute:Na+ symporter
MERFQLNALDLSIMLGYLLLIILYGLYKGKRESSEDYFLAGRNMTWPIVGISLFAANISSNTLIGLASDAYNKGIAVYNYEWMAAVVLVFFAAFFLPFYLRTGVYTMPEFLERRFDSRSRYYFSFITVVGNIIVDTASGLFAGTLIFQLLLPDTPPWIIVTALAFATAIYTIPGGLSSVVHTEVIQAILLIIGSTIITFVAYNKVGGWGNVMATLEEKFNSGYLSKSPDDMLSVIQPINDTNVPWLGLITGVFLLGFYFWANNQYMVQRVLSARNVDHGRWGALFAGLLKLPVIFIMVLPGTMAIALYADTTLNIPLPDGTYCANLIDCPNYTYPMLMLDLLPHGLTGLVLAGLLAAMGSSISATFNSASTLITMDFVNKLRPGLTSKQLVRAGQITTLILVILAAAWTPIIASFKNLWEYLQTILSYIAPPVVAVFITGLFWKRANGHAAIAAFAVGFSIAMVLVLNNINGWMPSIRNIHFLYMTGILFVICLITVIVVSLATAPPPVEKTTGMTWTRKVFEEETLSLQGVPWYKNYRILSILLLIATAIVVGMFW